jgi:N-[(2S)-2-amino-2-carboxyethyl]-L-glutamate dehydrogenase
MSRQLLYLCQEDVRRVCAEIDSVAVMREVFALHGSGQTVLPDEAYLAWSNTCGENARSLNMPGYVAGDLRVAGTKIINGNIANPARNLSRASGLTLLFDEISARPICVMEGAFLSSLRTASVTLLAAELLACEFVQDVALIGAGALAQAHIELLLRRHADFPHLGTLRLFDVEAKRAAALLQRMAEHSADSGITLQLSASAEEAIRPAQLIVPVTTTTTGYIPFAWLSPGSLLVNISLDDPLPEVVLRADRVIVDDWNLVSNDTRRLLGRMYRAGQLQPPGAACVEAGMECRCIDAQLGDVVTGTKRGRTSQDEIILVNPFGLAIEDIALAAYVYRFAIEHHLGVLLEV